MPIVIPANKEAVDNARVLIKAIIEVDELRHPELRDIYFGNYTKLVYQAQTDDPALTEKARAVAERLGLAFERRFTGYGDLARELASVAQR